MKKIICFGDSNTYGFNPKNGSRFDKETRWTGILDQMLGDVFQVIEEGCNNRTGFCKNPDGILQTGADYLPILLEKHVSFDTFIIALGTNDLQKIFEIDPNIVQNGLQKLTNNVRKTCPKAKIIIIPPVLLSEEVLSGGFAHQFDENSIKASEWIQPIYQEFATQENCIFCDINKFVETSGFDGLHFDEEAHQSIANIISKHILG